MLNNIQDLITVLEDKPPFEILEYIELDGTQYFDTGYYGNTIKTSVDFDLSIDDFTNNSGVCGSRNDTTATENSMSILFLHSPLGSSVHDALRLDWVGGNGSIFSNTLVEGARYHVTCTSNKGTVNDEVYTATGTRNFDQSQTFLIGTVHSGNGVAFNPAMAGKIYVFRIFEEGVLIKDYIPVLDKQGKPCLFDRVNKEFLYHTNITGSTVPTYKKWINKQDVEYISSNGSQYVTTSIYPDQNTAIECTARIDTWGYNPVQYPTYHSTNVFGSGSDGSTDAYTFGIGTPSILTMGRRGGVAITGMDASLNTKYVIYQDKNGASYNDISLTYASTPPSVKATTNPLTFFKNPLSNVIGNLTMYGARVWQSNNLILNLKPVVYQGTACLYDSVYNKIYTNAGTGEFKHGDFLKEDTNEYEVLQYLQTDGTQYYKTGEILSSTSKVECRAAVLGAATPTGSAYFFGAYGAGRNFGINKASSTGSFCVWGSNSTAFTPTLNLDTFYDISLSSNGLYVDGTKVLTPSGTFTGANEAYISWANGTSQPVAKIKIASLRIYQSGILVRDYIPVLDENMVPCLYDRCNRMYLYHTNSEGTNYPTYVVWNKKNIEYAQSTNTQYVNTGYVPSMNTGIKIKMSWQNFDGGTDNYVIGCRSVSNTDTRFWTGEAHNSKDFTPYLRGGVGTFTAQSTLTITPNEINTLQFNYNGDRKTYWGTSSYTLDNAVTFTPTKPMYMFAVNAVDTPAQFVAVKVYKAEIYEGTALVRDYYPVYNNDTNKAGLYDTICNRFISSLSGTELIAGPDMDIKKPRYEILKSITLNGTQYFDTGYYGTLNTKLEAGISFANLDTHMMVFGARNGGAQGTSNVSCLAAFGYPTANDKILVVDFNNESSYANYRLSIKSSNLTVDTFYDIIDSKNSRSIAIDGIYPSPASGTNPQTTSATTAFSSQYTITIGTVNGASFGGTTYYNLSGRIRYFRIFEQGVLIRDYIPVLDEDGIPCLFDRVTETFLYHTNISGTDVPTYERWNKYEVDYIESTGTQYINTEYYNNINSEYRFKAKCNNDSSGARAIFGALNTNNTASVNAYLYYADVSTRNARWGDKTTVNTSATSLLWHEGVVNKNSYKVDNEIAPFTDVTFSGTSDREIVLFGINPASGSVTSASEVSISYFQIYDNGQLVRDFIPTVYNSRAGLYDKVYNKFYQSATNTGFKAYINAKINGSWVALQVGDSIESTGTQYINTGLTTNAVMDINALVTGTYGLTYSSSHYSGQCFGSRISTSDNAFYYANGITNDSVGNGTSIISTAKNTSTNKFEVHYSKSRYLIKDNVNTSFSGVLNIMLINSGLNFYLFGINDNGNANLGTWKYSYFSIALNTPNNYKIVREYIPVKLNTTIGLYDKVTKSLYVNDGTGDFTFNDFN